MKRLACHGLIVAVYLGLQSACAAAEPPVRLNVDDYERSCGIEIVQQDSHILVTWPIDPQRRARLTLDLVANRALIDSIAISSPDFSPLG